MEGCAWLKHSWLSIYWSALMKFPHEFLNSSAMWCLITPLLGLLWMELPSQIEVHGCYEQFLRHCSKANRGCLLPASALRFWIKIHIPCPLTWGCCFIYDLYLVYCSLFLLSHFHQLISNSDSHLTQLQKLHVCVTLFSSCLDPVYQKFLCLFLPFPWTRWKRVSKIRTFSMLIFKQSLFKT